MPHPSSFVVNNCGKFLINDQCLKLLLYSLVHFREIVKLLKRDRKFSYLYFTSFSSEIFLYTKERLDQVDDVCLGASDHLRLDITRTEQSHIFHIFSIIVYHLYLQLFYIGG